VTVKGVEYLPSFGSPSDTGWRMMCLGNPEGRVSFGSLVTRGFRPFRDELPFFDSSLVRVHKHGKKVWTRDRTLA